MNGATRGRTALLYLCWGQVVSSSGMSHPGFEHDLRLSVSRPPDARPCSLRNSTVDWSYKFKEQGCKRPTIGGANVLVR